MLCCLYIVTVIQCETKVIRWRVDCTVSVFSDVPISYLVFTENFKYISFTERDWAFNMNQTRTKKIIFNRGGSIRITQEWERTRLLDSGKGSLNDFSMIQWETFCLNQLKTHWITKLCLKKFTRQIGLWSRFIKNLL